LRHVSQVLRDCMQLVAVCRNFKPFHGNLA
jgi:hypothetical protein